MPTNNYWYEYAVNNWLVSLEWDLTKERREWYEAHSWYWLFLAAEQGEI
jgi:hypothetical protein